MDKERIETLKKDFPEAFEKADLLIDAINSANLSPFEKYLLIHDFSASKPHAAQYFGTWQKGFGPAMQADYIDCLGHSEIMSVLCEMAGIKCEEIDGHRKGGGHAYNAVYIKDPKYGIDDYFICDSTWDSLPAFMNKGLVCYAYAVMPIQDLKHEQHCHYPPYTDMKWKNIPMETKKPVKMETLKEALSNAYAGILGCEQKQINNSGTLAEISNIFKIKKSNVKSTDDEEYQKFQDGTLVVNPEMDYYKKRIDESLELSAHAYTTAAVEKPSKAIKSCFYNHKKHLEFLEEQAELENEETNAVVLKRK